MATLQRGFSALRDGEREDFTIEGVERPLTVCSATPQGEQSTLRTDETGFRWECSHDIIALAADLVEPLLGAGAAHQFMDVDGLAEQVIIARDE